MNPDPPSDAALPSVNRALSLRRRPSRTAVQDSDFELVEAAVPRPRDGELLVRTCFLGFDPAQRGWLNDQASYVDPVQIGEVMRASAVGEVVVSRHPEFTEGDVVSGFFGWQEFAIADGGGRTARAPSGLPPTAALGVLGTAGLTAYIGVNTIGRPRHGEVFLVSAAAGATGSIAGQLARLAGAHVIGIAGGPEKCRWLVETARFDAAIDYKNEDLADRLSALAPNGVDVFYDNVGGKTLDTALEHLSVGARVVIGGAISTRYAPDGTVPHAIRNLPLVMLRRVRMQGFIVLDHEEQFPEARHQLTGWLRKGDVVAAENIQVGDLVDAPATLRRMFRGENIGKQILQIAQPVGSGSTRP